MEIEINNAIAVCLDCERLGEVDEGKFIGSLSIGVWQWGHMTSVGLAKGPLVRKCAEHHDLKRVWGEEDTPKHDEFDVCDGLKKIGQMGVATITIENRFVIEDREIQREFLDLVRAEQRAHGY